MLNPGARKQHNRSEMRTLLLLGGLLAVIYLVFIRPEQLDLTISEGECSALNKLWQEKYQSEFRVADNWSADAFPCMSKQSGFVRALLFLDDLEIEQAADGGGGRVDFYDRLKRSGAVIERRLLFSQSGRTLFGQNTIVLGDITLDANDPVEIAGVLMHELRHLEQGVNTHVPCVREPRQSCDAQLLARPQDGGAYNFGFYFLHLVRQHSNASARDKRLAQRHMQKIFDGRFNTTPAGAREFYDLKAPISGEGAAN